MESASSTEVRNLKPHSERCPSLLQSTRAAAGTQDLVGLGGLAVVAISLLSGLLGCSEVTRNEQPPEADLAIVGADVLTMEGDQLLSDQTVLVNEGRISAVGARAQVSVPSGARIIEAKGRTLMPGLVDAHIHLRDAEPAALVDYLRAGITCAREMNGRPFLLEWRDRINSGELVGPWLHVAAPTIGNWSSPKEGFPTPESIDQARSIVQGFQAEGYDWIKIYSFLPQEGFRGVMEESSRLGLEVGGHVPVAVGLSEALSSGLRSIEHLTEYVGSTLTPQARELDESDFRSIFGAGDIDWDEMDALIRATVAGGVWNVPTLVWFDQILPVSMAEEAWADPHLRSQGRQNRREIVKRLHEAGALLAVGTDSDAGDQLEAAAIHDELEAMTEAGLEPGEVLRLATVGGATLLGALRETGTIKTAKRADLLLLPCDPRNDLACLRRPEKVIARGRVVEAPSSP